MLRAALSVLACLLLGACSGWVSDKRLFGDGDWAHLNINGPYKAEFVSGESEDRLILKSRSDGLIESRNPDDLEEQRSLIGLVPIKGGSGEYFLSVDRSDDTDKGDAYFIVHVPTGSNVLEYYFPDCDGTSAVEGMTKVREEQPLLDSDIAAGDDQAPKADVEPVCKFSTKDALMAAGLEAEKFLSGKHVVAIAPLARFSPDDEADKPIRRPRPRPSRR